MTRLVYPIRHQMKTLPANTSQHTYKLIKFFLFSWMLRKKADKEPNSTPKGTPSTCQGPLESVPVPPPPPPPNYSQKSGNLDTSNPCLTPSSRWGVGPGGRRPSRPSAASQITPKSGLTLSSQPPTLYLVSLPHLCEELSKCNEATGLDLRYEGTAPRVQWRRSYQSVLTPEIPEMGAN